MDGGDWLVLEGMQFFGHHGDVPAAIRAEVAAEVERMRAAGAAAPSLAVVLCGDNPASAVYVRNKQRAAEQAGIRFALHTPAATSTTGDLVALVRSLDADDEVDALLVQLPLPPQIDADAAVE